MRIRDINCSLALADRIKLGIIRLVTGHVPPPVLAGMYRKRRFGRPFFACVDEAVRHARCWSKAETELFAAFVSDRSRCTFCVDMHRAAAGRYISADILEQTLANPDTAPLEPRVRAALHFLECLTQTPEALGPEHIAQATSAGVSNEALAEAAYVQAVFAVINRVADALDFPRPDPQPLRRTTWILDRVGYRI